MKTAITTDSSVNPYASTLISALANTAMKPSCVISTEKSKADLLKREIRKSSFTHTLTKAINRAGSHQSVDDDPLRFLREYAHSHSYVSWNAPLPQLCEVENIEYLRVDNVNSKEAVTWIKEREIDVIINAGGGIFRRKIVEAPKIGILNAHMGYLPPFRGMNVLEWSLFYGNRIGVTLHFIDIGIDTGDILLFREIEIEDGDTIASLRAKSLAMNVEIMIEGIKGLDDGTLARTPQRPEDGKQYFVMHDRLKRIAEVGIKHTVHNS
jgi:folate-dependent phosphoribosylglycinamide formyltransferase PurN